MFELDVTAMSGNKSRMELFGPGMQRAEEGAFFSGGSEIQRGANGFLIIKFGYLMIKFGLHKGYPLLYCTRGGNRRLILKMRLQWSEI